MIAVSRRKEIAQKLIQIGRSPEEPVAFIEKGTTAEEKVVITDLLSLSLDPPKVEPPAVMVVGHVVRIRELLRDFIYQKVGS